MFYNGVAFKCITVTGLDSVNVSLWRGRQCSCTTGGRLLFLEALIETHEDEIGPDMYCLLCAREMWGVQKCDKVKIMTRCCGEHVYFSVTYWFTHQCAVWLRNILQFSHFIFASWKFDTTCHNLGIFADLGQWTLAWLLMGSKAKSWWGLCWVAILICRGF